MRFRPSVALSAAALLMVGGACAGGRATAPRTAGGRVLEAADETALLDGTSIPSPGPGAVELPFLEVTARPWSPPGGPAATDPCRLITVPEWEEWAGAPAADGARVLEDGEACGFVTADGTARTAVGFVPVADGSPRSAPPGPPTDTVGGLPARWAPGYPLADASSLIVTAPTLDLIVEMSASPRFSDAALHAAAVSFATLAWDRLR